MPSDNTDRITTDLARVLDDWVVPVKSVFEEVDRRWAEFDRRWEEFDHRTGAAG